MNICDDAKRAKKKKRDSLFFKMFSPLIYFEQEKTIEKVSKKLYTSKLKEKKKKQRRKIAFGTEKHKSSSRAVRGRYVYRSFLFSDHCVKQIDGMLPWVCSVIDHRGLKVVKTSVSHSPAPLLCIYHILNYY